MARMSSALCEPCFTSRTQFLPRPLSRPSRVWVPRLKRRDTPDGISLPTLKPYGILRAATVSNANGSSAEIDWDSLGFGLANTASTMYLATWTPEHGWQGDLQPYGNLSMAPAAQVLNYGQGIFEGMKARRSAEGNIVIFRPDMNAARFQDGADRLCMPRVPKQQFIEAVKAVVRANAHFVPPGDKGSLYIRPLLLGTGPILGLGPAPSYTFCVFAAAVGAYFKGGQLTPIDLLVENTFHRAAPGGMGGTKAAGNYSPVLVTQLAAKKVGFSDVVYLDAKTDTYLEEVSSCNIFVVKGNKIATPPISGTILPGVTRCSIIELASNLGPTGHGRTSSALVGLVRDPCVVRGNTGRERRRWFEVEERAVSVTEAMDADEVFTTGTAVVLCSVGSLTYQNTRKQFGKPGEPTPVALQLYTALIQLQDQVTPDTKGWVVPVC